jgi:RNA polymerase sigma factor (sigma-70 family)
MITAPVHLSTRSHNTTSESGEAVQDESPEPNTNPASPGQGLGPGSTGWENASDADLLTHTRAGDGAAFGELWRRHSRAARTVARSFTSSLDPDDLVQESFAKIYQALQKGGGPTGAFRPYLFTTVRNTASAWGRARREASIDTLESLEDPASRDEETMAALDRSLTATAFRSLPTRWQEVLWYCEVERMTPQQVAPLLAMKPNAVAALAYRAREGLRQAWIQAHIAAVPEDSEHRWTIERIGTYTRGSLGKRDAAKLEAHLDSCARCTIVAAEAREVGSRIALVLLPLAAGTAGATGYLAWMQTGAHTVVATAAMPAAVMGGHGMGIGTPIDPTVVGSLATAGAGTGAGAGAGAGSSAGGAGAGGASAAGSAASATTAAGASTATAAGAASAGVASAGLVTSGVVSGAIALVAATAVAAAVALGPGLFSRPPENVVRFESSRQSDVPTTLPTDPTPPPTAEPEALPEPTAPTPPAPIPPAPTPAPAPAPAPAQSTPPSESASPPSQPGPLAPTPTAPPVPTEPEEPEEPTEPLEYTVDQGGHGELYPTLTGSSEPGATIDVFRSGVPVARVVADGDGRWASPMLTDTPVGSSALTIRQTTASGAVEERTESVTLPPPPVILSPTDGTTVSAFDLSIDLDGIPGTVVHGRIDGEPAFTCSLAEAGGEPACEWITDWVRFGLGEHTVQVAYGEGTDFSVSAPTRSIRVTVVLAPVADDDDDDED